MKAIKFIIIAMCAVVVLPVDSIAFAKEKEEKLIFKDFTLGPTSISEFFERVRSGNSHIRLGNGTTTQQQVPDEGQGRVDATSSVITAPATTSTSSQSEQGTTSTSSSGTISIYIDGPATSSPATSSTSTVPGTIDTREPPTASSEEPPSAVTIPRIRLFETVRASYIPPDIYADTGFTRHTTFMLVGFALSCGFVGVLLASGKVTSIIPSSYKSYRFTDGRIVPKNQ